LQGALEALDQLDCDYQIDLKQQRSRLVASLSRASSTDSEPCISVAVAAARTNGSPPLEKWVQKRRDRVQYARQQYAHSREAERTLRGQPEDTAANLSLGQFLCFAKGQFAQGLPLLARGSDPKLRQLADQVKLADAWWDYAAGADKQAQGLIRELARRWYGKAMPNLTGEAHTRVARRLEQLEQSNGPPVLGPDEFAKLLASRVWTIHWDNNRQWSELRVLPDHQWGLAKTITGPWAFDQNSIVADFTRKPNERLVFRPDGREVRVAYIVDGQLRHHGVARPE
jgi:hypothetical protein